MASMREIHGNKEIRPGLFTDEKGRYKRLGKTLGGALEECEWAGSLFVSEFGILRAMMNENRCRDVLRVPECAGRVQPMDGWIHRAPTAGHRHQHTYRT